MRAWGVLAGAALALIVLLVYGRAAGYPFLGWDDGTAVTENPLLYPPSWRNLGRFWSAPWTGLYVPVSFTVYWVEARLSAMLPGDGAPNPRVFHLGLLLLHFSCAGIVLRLLQRLVLDPRAAFLGALLFAIHPIQAESVSWVTETRGVLATFFGLLALNAYISGASAPRAASSLRCTICATAWFSLALLSKPSAVAVPLVGFLLDRFWLQRPLRRTLPLLSLWIAGSLVVLLVTRSQQPGSTVRFEAPLWARPLIALDSIAFYLEKLAWPVRLAADYGRKPAWLLHQTILYLHWIVPLSLVAVLAILPDRRTWLVAFSIFVAGLSPVLGLVSFDFQDISTVGDRYVYLAMLGPALALAAFVARTRGRTVVAAVSVAIAALGVRSWWQAGLWRNTEVLFRHTFELNSRSHIACVAIGAAREGDGRVEDAAQWYRKALEIVPGYPVAGGNLGRMLLKEERLDEAIEVLTDTSRRNPDYPYARQDLALALIRKGRRAEAEIELRELERLQPGFHGVHVTLGQLLYVTDRIPEAVAEFQAALDVLEGSAEAHQGLALAYAKLGRTELAEEHRQAFLRLSRGR